MPVNPQPSSEPPREERPISDKSPVRGMLALWGVALPTGIGAGFFGDWLGDKDPLSLAKLLEASLTPAAIMVSAAWVAIALAATQPPGRRRVRRDDLLFTVLGFSFAAVAGIALSLIYISSRTHLGSTADDIGQAAAGLMGLTLGGILQLMFRALLVVIPGKDEDSEATNDTAPDGQSPER